MPGQVHAAFERSTAAHGIIRGVDRSRALTMPGVLAVLTGRDATAAGLAAIPPAAAFPGRGGRLLAVAPIPPLAVDRVRYVGESVAIVVAETVAQAVDAAALLGLDLDPLPAAADVDRALAPGAHPIWPGAAGNGAFAWPDGDSAAGARGIRGPEAEARGGRPDTRARA